MPVLVITHPTDLTADLVIMELEKLGVPVLRANPADIGQNTHLDAHFTGGQWEGRLAVGSRSVELNQIRSVYYRRPTTWKAPEGMDAAEATWAAEEVRAGFGGVLMSLGCLWVNHPRLSMWASNKPVQLAAADAAGLLTPATIVTNVPDSAVAFAGTAPSVVYKTLSGSPRAEGAAVYTTRVDKDTIAANAAGVAYTLHQFQHEVPKDYEVRLTVVETEMFAARIDAGSAATRLDWRVDYDALTWSRIRVPPSVAASVHVFMRRLDLVFSTFDFVVTPAGDWVFLEANVNGQWGFIEQYTKAPIAAAIARRLAEGKPAT